MFCMRIAAVVLLLARVVVATGDNLYGFVVAGRRFSYLVSQGKVRAFGSNSYGQLGVGSTEDQNFPNNVILPNGSFVVDAAAGAFHGLFLTNEGLVFATGWNRFGQFGLDLGDNTSHNTSQVDVPVDVPVEVHAGVTAVAAGYGHSLFLINGRVEACGLNHHGQLGDGTRTSSRVRTTVQLPNSTVVVGIAAGYDFSYFLTGEGVVFAVGQNLGGQLGDGTQVTKLLPVKVSFSSRVSAIAAGESHGIILQESDGMVYTFGAGFNGQLGSPGDRFLEPSKALFDKSQRIFAGGDSTCAVGAGRGDLFCSGSNLDGQLGLGEVAHVREPAQVPDVLAYTMAMSSSHSLVMKEDDYGVLVSGSNANGELGDGTNSDANIFKELDTNKTYTSTTVTSTTARTTTAGETTRNVQEDDGVDVVMVTAIVLACAVIAMLAAIVWTRLRKQGDADDEPAEDFGRLELQSQ